MAVANQRTGGFNPGSILTTANIEKLENAILADNQQSARLPMSLFTTRSFSGSDTIRFPLGSRIESIQVDVSDAGEKDASTLKTRYLEVTLRNFATLTYYSPDEFALQGANALGYLMGEMPKARARTMAVSYTHLTLPTKA